MLEDVLMHTYDSSWLYTKLYKGVWNILANNSEPEGHKDLGLGQIVYILAGFSLRILVAGENCNVTGEYYERGSTSE